MNNCDADADKYNGEVVLVFPSALVKSGSYIASSEESERVLASIVANCMFIKRCDAEVDPRFRQVIPYCVFVQGSSVFCYRRTKKSGESRLVGQWSVGFGGHINLCDEAKDTDTTLDVVANTLARELDEEVCVRGDGKVWQGDDFSFGEAKLLVDDSNEVGRVHAGRVYVVYLPAGFTVTTVDPAIESGRFFPVEDCRHDNFENWSRLVLVDLFREAEEGSL